jgi:hypothetical protein
MALNPDAVPVGVPHLETIGDQVKDEIAEVLGREDEAGRDVDEGRR